MRIAEGHGFSGLKVHGREVQAIGTTDYISDVGKQRLTFSGPRAPSSAWDTVHGELMTFDDPDRHLVALDALEGYVPGEKGLYKRVLIPAEVAGSVVLAWVYRIERAFGVYLPNGRWPASDKWHN